MTIKEEVDWVNEMFDGMEAELFKRRKTAVNRAAIDALDRCLATLKEKRKRRLLEIGQNAVLSST